MRICLRCHQSRDNKDYDTLDDQVCKGCLAAVKRRKLAKEMTKRKEERKAGYKTLPKGAKDIEGAKRHADRNRENARKKQGNNSPQYVQTFTGSEAHRSTPDNLTPEEIELAQRELCRRHLLPYVQRFVPNYDPGWVHIDICERLEKFYDDVEKGLSPRLMLFMPPRHGKSELASVNFPSWAMGKNPRMKIIACSYASDLATDFSRAVRDRVRYDPAYHALFPGTTLNRSQESVANWATEKGGQYVAAGVDGPIGGKGGRIMIMDDPVKNREDADSAAFQNKCWSWFRSTFMTRTEPGGGILIIQTRWSDMDTSQRLLDLMAQNDQADQWEVIMYPALAEEDEYINMETREIIRGPNQNDIANEPLRLLRKEGDPLHPARYPKKVLETYRITMGAREWNALYQQRPTPKDGIFFHASWIIRRTAPAYQHMRHIMAVDLAIGEKHYHHQTAIVTGAIDYERYLHIRNVLLRKMSAHEIVDTILNIAQGLPNLMAIGIENGALKTSLQDQFRLETRKRNFFPTFDNELTPVNDKEIRARPFQGLMQGGMVIFPSEEVGWYPMALHQLMRFPAAGEGKDDIVDALAWLGRMYFHVHPPMPPKPRRQNIGWREKLRQEQLGKRSPMAA